MTRPILVVCALLAGCVPPGEGDGVPVDAPDDDDDAPAAEGPDCLLPDPDAAAWVFEDVAPELGISDADGKNMGVAARDLDGDGVLDLVLANGPDPAALYLGRSDGTFAAHPSPPSGGADTSASTPDFDDDGDADVYITCGGWDVGCPNRLFRNDGLDRDGTLRLSDTSSQSGISTFAASTFGGTWADYDLDGDLDLFQPAKALQGSGAPPSRDLLFRNDGDGRFTEVGEDAGIGGEGDDSHPSAWLDFDEDGDPDLFVTVHRGDNRLLENLGDGTFADVTPDALKEPHLAFAAVTADFDNDGHADLLVSGRTVGGGGNDPFLQEHGLFLGDGAGGWTDASFGTGLNDPGDGATHVSTMGLQAGDLDLDGFPEVMFGNGSPEAGEVNALGSFVPVDGGGVAWIDRTDALDVAGPGYPYRTHGAAFFDYEGDGDVDLYLGNGGGSEAEPNRLLRNTGGPDHGWVEVALVGTASARDAVGARVRVADGPPGDASWQVFATVTSGTGFNSAHPAALLVGTGRCGGPYHVEVRWPGGATQVLDGVEAGAKIEIVEGG